MAIEAFPEKLKRLVAEKGTSISRIYDRAEWTGPGEKPSKGQLDKAMTGDRPIRPEVIEMLANALDVDADEFVEYQLWLVREALDPNAAGLERAVENLGRLRADLVLDDGTVIEVKAARGARADRPRVAAERLAQALAEAAAANRRAQGAVPPREAGRGRSGGRGAGGAA